MSEFESIRQVNAAFFNLFLNGTTLKEVVSGTPPQPHLTIGGKDVLVRYANRSGANDAEDLPVVYPCIVIHAFPAEIDKKRAFLLPFHTEGDFAYDENEGNWKGKKMPLAVPFECMFQVDFAAARESEFMAMQEWFFSTFDIDHPEPCFLMNVVKTPEGDLGAVVPYKVETQPLMREEGFFEVAHTFTLCPYVYLKVPKETITLVEEVGVAPIPRNLYS
jgi:hypothetical protein